jgi:hypothetical protein
VRDARRRPGSSQALALDLSWLGLGTIPIYTLGAAITTHAGPGALGVRFFTACEAGLGVVEFRCSPLSPAWCS